MAFRPLDPQWNVDPYGRHELRFWNGQSWTDRVADRGIENIDPVPLLDAGGAPAPTKPLQSASEPTPRQRVSEPAPILVTTDTTPKYKEPFSFTDRELDIEPPKSVDLDRLEGGGNRLGLVIGGLLALVIAGAAALFLLGGDDDPDVATPDTTVVQEIDGEIPTTVDDPSAPFPTKAESEIIDRLPAGFSCSRSAPDSVVENQVASVICTAESETPVALTSTAFTSRAAGDEYLDLLVEENGSVFAEGSDCSTPTEGLWTGEGFSGRVVCGPQSTGPFLTWTIGSDPVINTARGLATTDELVSWWNTTAVPGPVDILEPFPTPDEGSALANLPVNLAETCTRFVGEPTPRAKLSFECRPDDGASVAYLDSFGGKFDLESFFGTFELPRLDKGACRLGVPGNNTFSIDGEVAGRVACYVKDDLTWIHWFDTRNNLAGQASFVDTDVTQPFEWWASTVVPGAVEDRTFDRAENRAFELVPADIADSCVAESVRSETDRWSARLGCIPNVDGVLSVTYFAFSSNAKVRNELKVRQGETARNTGSCDASGVPAELEWTSGDRGGRQLCQIVDGVAEIFASDVESKTAVLVVAENDDIGLIKSWLDANR